MAVLANVALTNTFDTWRLRTNALLTRVNAYTINESSLYANTLTANVSFVSRGNAVFAGSISNTLVRITQTGSGNALVVEDSTNPDATAFAVTADGNVGIGTTTPIGFIGYGWLTINGSTGGNASFSANNVEAFRVQATSTFIDLNATASVPLIMKTNNIERARIGSTGLVTACNSLLVSRNLTVSGNTTIGASGKVANATGWFGVTGRATVSTNLFVGGNTTVVGTTTFRGPVNVGDGTDDLLTVTGRATISQNLNVSGNTTFGASGKTSNTTGWFGVTGRATISTNLFVGGNTTLNGTTTDRSNALSQTLTDGATINWDASLGRVATVTLGGNRTIAAPTNLRVGTYILYVVQDGTGGRTLTWNSAFKWTAAVAPPLTTTANARDIFSFVSDGTNLYGSFIPDVR
jgi:hypothetical protein